MRRIAIIGAGSIVFCKTLITDIMATTDLEETEFVLMAPSTSKTSQVKAYTDKVIKRNGMKSRVSITTDRREALKGADYVICSFQIGSRKRKKGGSSDRSGTGYFLQVRRIGEIIKNPCKWWRHRIPGEGDVDWNKFVTALHDIQYEGMLSIEHEDPIWSGSDEKIEKGLLLAKQHLEAYLCSRG